MKTAANAFLVAGLLGLVGLAGLSALNFEPVFAAPVPTQPQEQRIEFAPGASAATVTGTLDAHMTHTYLVKAEAGQMMCVNVDSPEDADVITIYGVDGTVLTNGNMPGGHSWYGPLPLSEDYIVHVMNGSETPNTYSLTVRVD